MQHAPSHVLDLSALSRFVSKLRAFRDDGGAVVGYARSVCGSRALADEVGRLELSGCGVVFADEVPGRAVIRPQLARAIEAASPGDAIAVLSLPRLTWREDELCEVLAVLEARELHLISALEGFDTRETLDGFAMARLWTFFRENVALVRVAESVRRAPARPGRKPGIADEDWALVADDLREKRISTETVMARFKVSRSAVYRRLASCA